MKTNGNEPITPMINEHFQLGLIGLTKREHFAAMFVQGILSNSEGGMTEIGFRAHSPESVSSLAILHADALIESLNK